MFQVKICGITSVEDALTVVEAGADAVGLNFYPKSPRYVRPELADRIAAVLPPTVVKVGLFVNATSGHVCQTFQRLGLDLVQLHGDEPPAYLAELGQLPVMRAFRLGHQGLEAVGSYLGCARQLGCLPRLTLIDAHVKGVYGGSGEVADWQLLRTCWTDRQEKPIPPLVLAGGLTPDNVAEAIRTVRPAAVDVASGVESRPPRKDRRRVAAFVEAAHRALEKL